MRNRAKCKLCKSIIESYATVDYVSCKCGEIAIAGGESKFECYANDLTNIIRVDDDGNEIIPKVIEMPKDNETKTIQKWIQDEIEENGEKRESRRKELIDRLEEMLNAYENVPQHVKAHPINHSDFAALLILLSLLFRADD